MYRITISPDKNPGQYQATLERRFWLFWRVSKLYRGPYTWITIKAENLKQMYNVSEIINNVTFVKPLES